MNFNILKILKIIYFNKMGQEMSTKQALGIGAAACVATYEAGYKSGKWSGEQYAKGFQAGIDRSNT